MFNSRKPLASRPLRQTRRQDHKPIFETLEDRQHFSVYTVTNTNDSGTGSLRTAIIQADAGAATVINFNIPNTDPGFNRSTGIWTINVASQLPAITKAVEIDGFTQEAPFVNQPLVEINGQHAPAGTQGLVVQAANSSIFALSIEHFSSAGIVISASANDTTVYGNVISNCGYVGIMVASNYNTIGVGANGNVITSNNGDAILILGSHNTVTGSTLTNNLGDGVNLLGLNADNNTISDNTISGNAYGGVEVGAANYFDSIVGNSISQFALPGINLHSGGNNAITAPQLSSAKDVLGTLTVTGTGNTFANSSVEIEFFASPPGATNEGVTFQGSETVQTNSAGQYSFSASPYAAPIGDVITATATVTRNLFNPITRIFTSGSETSQFSNNETEVLAFPIVRFPLVGLLN